MIYLNLPRKNGDDPVRWCTLGQEADSNLEAGPTQWCEA